MKELRFWLFFFAALAFIIWFAQRIQRDELPGRGVWDGRTFTNKESGICLTVPDAYKIYTDAEIIEMYDYPEDVYENVKRETNYFDMQIGSGNSILYTVYMALSFNCTAEQYINIVEVNYNYRNNSEDRKVISSKQFEKVICGQTYNCLGITYEGGEIGYRLWCIRYIPKKGWVYIQIETENEEKANELLSVFDTEAVRVGISQEIYWWFERVF